MIPTITRGDAMIDVNTLPACPVETEVPPRVEYSLTDTGHSLKTVIDALWNWGEDYKAKLAA